MKKDELKFSDNKDNSATLTRSELSFFGSRMSLFKVYYGLFVIKKLVQNGAFSSVILFAKGVFNVIFNRKESTGLPLSWDEYYEIVIGVLGFRSDTITVTSMDCTLTLAAKPKQCLINSIIELNEILISNQYNISEKNIYGKVVIDAGANLGIFSIYAAKRGAKKVYAFEPIAGTYMQMKANISLNAMDAVIVPCKSALGEKNGKKRMFYNFAGDAGASFSDHYPKNRAQTVKITTIDSFMQKKEKLDFLKIDEEKILLGAKRTIRKHKPVLSFSAYHKPDDKVRLPSTVNLIRPDYKCVLLARCEEDFYCE